jgi:hypothetical protein
VLLQDVREPADDMIEEPPRGRQSETDMQEQAEVRFSVAFVDFFLLAFA